MMNSFATYEQAYDTHMVIQDFLTTIDDNIINELFAGNENDLKFIFDELYSITYEVLFGGVTHEMSGAFSFLPKMSVAIEETFRCESLNYFIMSVMEDFEMNWHHFEWGEMAMRKKWLAVLAARDHGKSFFFSNAFAIWSAYRYKKSTKFNPQPQRFTRNKRILLISFSLTQSRDLVEIIKGTIEENANLKERLFSDNIKAGWGKDDLRFKTGSRLTPKSFGSSMRGIHPGIIVVDDGLVDNVIYSKAQREKSKNHFHSVIMNAIVPEGQVIVVGTPFHQDDLYSDLKSKTKAGWHVREYPAVFPNGMLLWSNRYTFNYLSQKRLNSGNLIFSREMLCKPVANDSTIFPYEILKKSITNTEKYKLVNNRQSFGINFDAVVIGCDFAISANVGADYSVFTVFGLLGNEIWLMHLFREKGLTFTQQMAKLKSLNINFNPDLIVLEDNQMQAIFVQSGEELGLPIMAHNTNTNKNKLDTGLPSLAINFEKGHYKIPTGDTHSLNMKDLIFSEFGSIAFTDGGLQSVGEHDDIPMSFWIASRGIQKFNASFKFTFL